MPFFATPPPPPMPAIRVAEDPPATPDWAKDAVWYQIFPERFRNGEAKSMMAEFYNMYAASNENVQASA